MKPLKLIPTAVDVFDYTLEHKLTPDVLINNAGFGDKCNFAESDWEKQYNMVQVNITARSEVGVKEIRKKNERINRHYDHRVSHFVILWFGD